MSNLYTYPAGAVPLHASLGGVSVLTVLFSNGDFYTVGKADGGTDRFLFEPSARPNAPLWEKAVLNLPSGVAASDVKYMRSSSDIFMIITHSGEAYVVGYEVDTYLDGSFSTTAFNLINMPSGVTISDAHIADNTMFILGSDGNFYRYGSFTYEGDGTGYSAVTGTADLMVQPSLGGGLVQFEVGHEGSYLVLDGNGEIHVLGENTNGQLGIGSTTDQTTWTKISGVSGAKYISAGRKSSYNVAGYASSYIGADDKVYVFGYNDSFNWLTDAIPLNTVQNTPVLAAGHNENAIAVKIGGHVIPYLNTDYDIVNTGHNAGGAFGDGTGTNRSAYIAHSLDSLLGGGANLNLGCGSLDTDNDGTPDYLDLDSDNDGCPDVLEGDGGFTYAAIQNDTLTGGVDVDGVPIAATSIGQTVGTATDSTTISTACDTDQDGIINALDLDDDNDGILDIIEFQGGDANCPQGLFQVLDDQLNYFDFSQELYVPYGVNTGIQINAMGFDTGTGTFYATARTAGTDKDGDPIAVGNIITVDRFTGEVDLLNTTANSNARTAGDVYNGIYYSNTANNTVTTYDIVNDVVSTITLAGVTFNASDFVIHNGVMYGLRRNNNNQGVNLFTADLTAATPTVTTTSVSHSLTFPGTSGRFFGAAFVVEGNRLFFSNNSGVLTELLDYTTGTPSLVQVANSQATTLNDGSSCPATLLTLADTDNDGTPDYLDLDSDNDGCPDALEGGGGFTYASIQNDTLTGGVDADGIPLAASGGQGVGESANDAIADCACPDGMSYTAATTGEFCAPTTEAQLQASPGGIPTNCTECNVVYGDSTIAPAIPLSCQLNNITYDTPKDTLGSYFQYWSRAVGSGVPNANWNPGFNGLITQMFCESDSYGLPKMATAWENSIKGIIQTLPATDHPTLSAYNQFQDEPITNGIDVNGNPIANGTTVRNIWNVTRYVGGAANTTTNGNDNRRWNDY